MTEAELKTIEAQASELLNEFRSGTELGLREFVRVSITALVAEVRKRNQFVAAQANLPALAQQAAVRATAESKRLSVKLTAVRDAFLELRAAHYAEGNAGGEVPSTLVDAIDQALSDDVPQSELDSEPRTKRESK